MQMCTVSNHFLCRFLQFDHMRIPRLNLLNKNAGVTKEGKYVTVIKDARKRFSAQLGTLSMGRVSITGIGVTNLKSALVIAVRLVVMIIY